MSKASKCSRCKSGIRPPRLVASGSLRNVVRLASEYFSSNYYSRAVTIMDAEQLGGALIEQLATLFERR